MSLDPIMNLVDDDLMSTYVSTTCSNFQRRYPRSSWHETESVCDGCGRSVDAHRMRQLILRIRALALSHVAAERSVVEKMFPSESFTWERAQMLTLFPQLKETDLRFSDLTAPAFFVLVDGEPPNILEPNVVYLKLQPLIDKGPVCIINMHGEGFPLERNIRVRRVKNFAGDPLPS